LYGVGFSLSFGEWQPYREFKPKRGLRQGDPLAPFLFLIVVEGLTGLMRNARNVSIFKGVEVGSQRAQVDLLQFAVLRIIICWLLKLL